MEKLTLNDIFISVKQNFSHAWFLGPHTLGKLTLNNIFISIKQNLSHAWFLESHALEKLTLNDIFISVKQNLSHAWFLGPHTLGKLTLNDIFISVKQNSSHDWSLGSRTWGKLTLWYLLVFYWVLKQIQDYTQLLRLMALSKLKSLFIYLSNEQDKGCLPFLFFTKYIFVSIRFSLYCRRVNSQYKYVVNLFIAGIWSNYLNC